MITWAFAGREFRTAQEIIQYVESLPEANQAGAIEGLRSDMTRLTIQNDQMMHDIYAWVTDRNLRREMNHPDTREAWSYIRGGYLRVRQREREGRANLAGEGGWCTQEFWDQVVAPLTGASREVADVLKLLRARGISPIEAMRQGCMEMLRRLSGESQTRSRKDMHCTAGDLRVGNVERPSSERLNQARLAASGFSVNLHLDEYGFLWRQPPPTPINQAVHQQQNRDNERAAEKASKDRAAKAKPKQPTTGSEDAVTPTTPSPQGGPASNLRKRSGKAKVEDGSPASSPRGRQISAIKRPRKEQPSPVARQITEMDKVLGELDVISTKTARRRATSLSQQGKSEGEWPSPNRMAIPVKNSTKNQQAIWEVIEKKVKGIRFKQKIDISHEAARVMELPAAELVREIEPIAKGLAQAPATDDTILVYTQCMLDAYRAQIATRKGRTSEMSELRTVVGTWHRRYHDRYVTLVPGSVWRGGVRIRHYDMTSLLLGEAYDGWLNGDLLHAILTVTLHDQYVVPTRAFDYWHQGNHANNMFDVPDGFPSLIVPVHWGNHWALLIADRATGQIYYLDSLEVEGRRQMAVASMRNFLNAHPAYNTITWQANPRRSAQQTNTYDCGIWVVNNAWAWQEQAPSPTEVGLPERVQIGRALLASAEVADESRMPVPTDEVEYLGESNLSMTPESRPPTETPSAGQSFSSVTPQRERLVQTARAARRPDSTLGPPTRPASTSTSRMGTPQLEQAIGDAMGVLHIGDPATPSARLTRSSLSPAPSQLQTPPGLREAMNAGVAITSRGSPVPRSTARTQTEPPPRSTARLPTSAQTMGQQVQPQPQQFARERKLRSGKEH